MRRVALAALAVAALAGSGRREAPAARPIGLFFLPEEAWLYARVPRGWWSAEMEEDNAYQVPCTDELKLQITNPLSEFRVRVIDGRGETVPGQQSAAAMDAVGQQVHRVRFARALDPGAYRIVVDAPLGGTLRDAQGRRYRGQRFRIVVGVCDDAAR